MQIEIIYKKNLADLIQGDLFKNLTVLPISSLRAQYFINQPKILPDDPLLVLVRENYETLAFAGFLPDETRSGERFAWNSGWWVDPIKGKKVALLPLLKGIELWHEKVAFADLPEHSNKILEALNRFKFLSGQNGQTFYLRPYALKSIQQFWLRQLISSIGQHISFVPKYCYRQKNISFQKIDNMNEALVNFIASHNHDGLTQRTVDDFERIKKYPWVSSNVDDCKQESGRYPFSLKVNHFESNFYSITWQSEIIGMVFLKNRDHHLSIPYLWCDANDVEKIIRSIVLFALESKANSITAFRAGIKQSLTQLIPAYCPRKEIYSRTAFGQGLELTEEKELMLQDGEGDCIFT